MTNILSIDREQLERACTSLYIPTFDTNEYVFLIEYHKAITPVAVALKTLEANKYTFGMYLPVLKGLRSQLNSLKSSTVKLCLPLINALDTGFEKRFSKLMDAFDCKAVPLYLAMVSNPKYKLNYLDMKRIPSHIFIQIRKLMVCAGVDIIRSEREHTSLEQQAHRDDSVVVVDDDSNQSSVFPHDMLLQCSLLVENDVSASIGSNFDVESMVEQEVQNYLTSKATPDIETGLQNFPIIAKIFKKFNCIRSTEAICERLFSYAGKIHWNQFIVILKFLNTLLFLVYCSFCVVQCLFLVIGFVSGLIQKIQTTKTMRIDWNF